MPTIAECETITGLNPIELRPLPAHPSSRFWLQNLFQQIPLYARLAKTSDVRFHRDRFMATLTFPQAEDVKHV
jgi:hypothetical protein